MRCKNSADFSLCFEWHINRTNMSQCSACTYVVLYCADVIGAGAAATGAGAATGTGTGGGD